MCLISYCKKTLLLQIFAAMDQNNEHIKGWRKIVKQQVTMMMIVFAEWLMLSLISSKSQISGCHKQILTCPDSEFRFS